MSLIRRRSLETVPSFSVIQPAFIRTRCVNMSIHIWKSVEKSMRQSFL